MVIDQATLDFIIDTAFTIAGIQLGMYFGTRLPAWMLGGVTTLDQALGNCTMCQQRMEAGSDIRKLSCGHVFHKDCDSSIDKWLRENDLACPVCRETARSVRVLQWKARPQPQPSASS